MSGTVVLSLVMATVGNVNVTIGFGNEQCTESMTQPVGTCFEMLGKSFNITKGCHDQNGFQRVTVQEFDGTTCERKRGGLRQVDADQCAPLRVGFELVGFQCNSRRFPIYGNKVEWSLVTNSSEQCKSVEGSLSVKTTDSAGLCSCFSWGNATQYGQCYKFLSCTNESQTITRVGYDLSDDECTTPVETRTFNVNTCMRDPRFDFPELTPGQSYSNSSCVELFTPSPATGAPDTPMPEAGGSLGPFFTLLATAAVMFVGL